MTKSGSVHCIQLFRYIYIFIIHLETVLARKSPDSATRSVYKTISEQKQTSRHYFKKFNANHRKRKSRERKPWGCRVAKWVSFTCVCVFASSWGWGQRILSWGGEPWNCRCCFSPTEGMKVQGRQSQEKEQPSNVILGVLTWNLFQGPALLITSEVNCLTTLCLAASKACIKRTLFLLHLSSFCWI